MRHDVAITVPGARASWPARREQLHAGAELVVLAELPEQTPVTVELVDARGRRDELTPRARPSGGPLFERAWSSSWLNVQLDTLARPEPRLLELRDAALQAHALTPVTALLALESGMDEYTYKVRSRHAPAQLVIEGDRVVEHARPGAAPRGSASSGAYLAPGEPPRPAPTASPPSGPPPRQHEQLERMERRVYPDERERLLKLERELVFDRRVEFYWEAARSGPDPAQAYEQLARVVTENAREHPVDEVIQRLAARVGDPALSLAQRACFAQLLRDAVRFERPTLGPHQPYAAPRASSSWPATPGQVAELVAGLVAEDRVALARRAASSLLEYGATPLDHAALLDVIEGAGAEARAAFAAHERARLDGVPAIDRPFTREWYAAMNDYTPSELGIELYFERARLSTLRAVSWLREGDAAKAAAALEDWHPRRPPGRERTEWIGVSKTGGHVVNTALAEQLRAPRKPWSEVYVLVHAPASLELRLQELGPLGLLSREHKPRALRAIPQPWPEALVLSAPARAPGERDDRWARVDFIENLSGAPRVTTRLVRLRSLPVTVPMPAPVLARAGCPTTAASRPDARVP
ncbi:MAG: hypothetical protein H6713_27070 [Myxococcales bacterium]|nr:hypothetical protein [Myxococcales bacterium]